MVLPVELAPYLAERSSDAADVRRLVLPNGQQCQDPDCTPNPYMKRLSMFTLMHCSCYPGPIPISAGISVEALACSLIPTPL